MAIVFWKIIIFKIIECTKKNILILRIIQTKTGTATP